MSKLIAVEGCELAFKNPLATGNITIIPPAPGTSLSSNRNKIYAKQIDIQITGYTIGGFVQTTPILSNIPGTASFATADGDPLVLEGDESEELTIPGQEGNYTTTKKDTVYVKAAGQNVVKAT